MKKLKTFAGKKFTLPYHRKKEEANYIISGELSIRYANENNELVVKIVAPGSWVHFPAGCIQQNFIDRLWVEKEFGLMKKPGLVTAAVEDITVK